MCFVYKKFPSYLGWIKSCFKHSKAPSSSLSRNWASQTLTRFTYLTSLLLLLISAWGQCKYSEGRNQTTSQGNISSQDRIEDTKSENSGLDLWFTRERAGARTAKERLWSRDEWHYFQTSSPRRGFSKGASRDQDTSRSQGSHNRVAVQRSHHKRQADRITAKENRFVKIAAWKRR